MSTAAACKEYFAVGPLAVVIQTFAHVLRQKAGVRMSPHVRPNVGAIPGYVPRLLLLHLGPQDPQKPPSSSSFTPVEKASFEIVAAGEIFSVVGIQTYNIWILAIWLH